MRTISIGDICKSKYYFSVEFKRQYHHNPPIYGNWYFGKTYNGTTHGLIVIFPTFVILAHRRSPEALHTGGLK